MATERREYHDENDAGSMRNRTTNERDSNTPKMVEAEPVNDETATAGPTPKTTVSEPCMTAMENYLLAHFFFIFAASFILGVIFLHSSLTFWSWQVKEDPSTYTAQVEAPKTFSFQEEFPYGYKRSQQQSPNDVLTAVISPNMTLSLTR